MTSGKAASPPYPATFPTYVVELLWLPWDGGGQPANGDHCFSERPTDKEGWRQQQFPCNVSLPNQCTSGRFNSWSYREESSTSNCGSCINIKLVCGCIYFLRRPIRRQPRTTWLPAVAEAPHAREWGMHVHMQMYRPNVWAYGHPVNAEMPLKRRGPESLRSRASLALRCPDAAAFHDHYTIGFKHLMTL